MQIPLPSLRLVPSLRRRRHYLRRHYRRHRPSHRRHYRRRHQEWFKKCPTVVLTAAV